MSSDQAKTHLLEIGRSSQIVSEFSEECQVGKIQVLGVINENTLDCCLCHRLNEPCASDVPSHRRNGPKGRAECHPQSQIFSSVFWGPDSKDWQPGHPRDLLVQRTLQDHVLNA